MNLDELNIFEGMSEDPSDREETIDNFDDLDCPVLGIIESMYLEPHPYGVTISTAGTERLLKELGYRIIEKDDTKYALKGQEKLSRSKTRREEQELLYVYRRVSEDLAISKFLKDWKDVFGSTGDTGEA